MASSCDTMGLYNRMSSASRIIQESFDKDKLVSRSMEMVRSRDALEKD